MDSTAFPTDPNSAEPVFNRTTNNAPAISAPKGRFPQPDVIASFDTEWVDGRHAEIELPKDTNRLLSYQMTILHRPTGRMHSLLVPVKGPHKRDRLSLSTLLARALHEALEAGVIDSIPDRLALVGHFTRADLSTLRDWPELKKRIDGVRGTYATTTRPLVWYVGGSKLNIIVVDTMLLSPQKSKLAQLGDVLGVPKVTLAEGVIERMDILMATDPELFHRYAIRDTVVAALWLDKIWTLLAEEFGISFHVPTLAAAGLACIEKALADIGVGFDEYFGYERIGRKRFVKAALVEVWSFSANAYHGARNECFHVGPTPDGLHDLDITGAYPTAMATFRVPDWDSQRRTTDLTELAQTDDALTVALADFAFPDDTLYPCQPVRGNECGLIYPLSGLSWCSGPELVVARNLKADITVRSGWRVDWKPDSPYPFAAFTRTIKSIRDRAGKGTVLDLLAKEIGNSAYGKIAQAVEIWRVQNDSGVGSAKGKRVFDTRTGQTVTLPPSRISNPLLASAVTGLARGLLSETLANLPTDTLVITATTDGILSTCPLERLDVSGPCAAAFRRARERIAGTSAIWERKTLADTGTLSCKTRMTFAAADADGSFPDGKLLITKGGYKAPRAFASAQEEAVYWDATVRTRTYDTMVHDRPLVSLRKQYETNCDLVPEPRKRRFNADYDMKRRLVNVRDTDGLITAETRPWRSIEEFRQARGDLERWKKAGRRVLRTSADYRDMQAWTAQRPGLKAVGCTSQSGRPALVQSFLKLGSYKVRGLEAPYRELARFVSEQGWPCSVATLKNTRRRGVLTYGAVTTLTPDEERFAEAVAHAYPDCPLVLFTAPRSPARAALERLGFRCHLTDPPIAQATPCSATSRPKESKPLRVKAKQAAPLTPLSDRYCTAGHHYAGAVRALLRSGDSVVQRQARAWQAILAQARAQAA